MLFTTINSELNSLINNVGILGVSFADIFNTFKVGYNSVQGEFSGLKSGLLSVKNAMSSTITSTDISNINEYNRLIDACVKPQTAWYRAMQNSSKAAQDLVINANGAKVSEEALAQASQKVATTSKLASTAMSMAFNIGISLAISGIVAGIQYLATANERLAESAKEAMDTYKDAQSTLKSNKETISEISLDIFLAPLKC